MTLDPPQPRIIGYKINFFPIDWSFLGMLDEKDLIKKAKAMELSDGSRIRGPPCI